MVKFDAADNAGKAAIITNGSYEELAALFESLAINDVRDDLKQIAIDNYIIARFIATTGLQAQYQRKPTGDNPLATGPDVDAVAAAAETIVANFKARKDTIDNLANILRNVVEVVAITCDLSVKQAYQLLVTGTLPRRHSSRRLISA